MKELIEELKQKHFIKSINESSSKDSSDFPRMVIGLEKHLATEKEISDLFSLMRNQKHIKKWVIEM
ncbi:MAG: hypothetical protein WC389_00165 [Lutibacter sp.]|jgi:hypothetical protein